MIFIHEYLYSSGMVSHCCILKSYKSEVHSQLTVETALELRKKHSLNPDDGIRTA
jgi:2-methylcitrate dehydratase PrpD